MHLALVIKCSYDFSWKFAINLLLVALNGINQKKPYTN